MTEDGDASGSDLSDHEYVPEDYQDHEKKIF